MTVTPDPFEPPREPATSLPVSGQVAGGPVYGARGYGPGPAGVVPRNGLGTAALVLGILAVVLSFTVIGGVVFGILALVFGFIGRGRVKRGEATNGGSALAGIILGALGLLLAIGLVIAGASLLNSDSGKKLQNCLDSAGSDTAAQQSCQQQFKDSITK